MNSKPNLPAKYIANLNKTTHLYKNTKFIEILKNNPNPANYCQAAFYIFISLIASQILCLYV